MKGIVVSSNSSGGGKTTVTLGLLKALKNRQYNVQPYKVGPDYIDPAFHTKITDNNCRNLDLFLMGEEGVKASFSRGKGDLAIIEGVMGFYDGKGTNTEGSTYEISELLDLPTVLVLSPKAQSSTLAAELLGILNYKKNSICGVIFNKVSRSYYELLKRIVEDNCSIDVFGYIPKDDDLSLASRHLGLIQSSEIQDLEEKVERCAELIEKYVDVDKLISRFKKTSSYYDDFHMPNQNINIAVAMDKSFSFYYKENLELLEEIGNVKYFSPLEDAELPKDIDFLYLGGGYPEVFLEKLSKNKSMIFSIKKALDNNLKCYAECGGMMYLTGGIADTEGNKKEGALVNYFEGMSYMTKRLQNFGYATIKINKANNFLPVGFNINCHEFHKSYVDNKETTIYNVEKINYLGDFKSWECGYVKNNTLGAYAHIHFFGNMDFLRFLFNIK